MRNNRGVEKIIDMHRYQLKISLTLQETVHTIGPRHQFKIRIARFYIFFK